MNVIHGEGKPRLVVYYSGTPTNIDFPRPMALIESFGDESLSAIIEGGDYHVQRRGSRYSCVLDFSKYATKETVEICEPIFDTTRDDWMKFYPHIDNTNIWYWVELKPGSALSLQQMPFHRGHRGLRLELVGKSRLSAIDLTNVPA